MEMNVLNVARHKLFRGKPSFVDKKRMKKSRFVKLFTEEIQEIYRQCRPSNDKKATKFEIKII